MIERRTFFYRPYLTQIKFVNLCGWGGVIKTYSVMTSNMLSSGITFFENEIQKQQNNNVSFQGTSLKTEEGHTMGNTSTPLIQNRCVNTSTNAFTNTSANTSANTSSPLTQNRCAKCIFAKICLFLIYLRITI